MPLNNPYALSFDGVDDYGAVGASFVTGYPFVIDATFSPKTLMDGVIVEGYYDNYKYFRIQMQTTGKLRYIFRETQATYYDYFTNHILSVDATYSLRFVCSSDTKKKLLLYNSSGELLETLTASDNLPFFTFSNLYFGKSGGLSPFQYFGVIDEIRIWNQEIQGGINKRLKGNEDGLGVYYRCDEGFGNILYDSSGNGNHGEIFGATWVPGIIDLDWGYIDVTTIMPIDVKYNSMTLKGNLRGLGDYTQAECYFQYTDDPNFETGIIETLHQAKAAPGEFEQTITGLDNSKTYYYRAVATGINA